MRVRSQNPLKAIYVHLTDVEFESLLKMKGKQTWHDFILSHTIGLPTTYRKLYAELEKRKHD